MYKKILVPVALDHRPNTAKALEVAQKLLSEGGQIIAVHAMEPVPGYVAHYIPEDQIKAGQEAAKAALVAELGGVKGIKTELIHGPAGAAIVEYADNHDVDCIVVASHKPGLQDYFLGSTAARVVRHAKCAVHVVR